MSIHTKDRAVIIIFDIRSSVIRQRREANTLPPSNPVTGKRFRSARVIDAKVKYKNISDPNVSHRASDGIALKKFDKGPHIQRKISSAYEKLYSQVDSDAPKISSLSSEREIRKCFAANMCPSSCSSTAKKTQKAKLE